VELGRKLGEHKWRDLRRGLRRRPGRAAGRAVHAGGAAARAARGRCALAHARSAARAHASSAPLRASHSRLISHRVQGRERVGMQARHPRSACNPSRGAWRHRARRAKAGRQEDVKVKQRAKR